VNRQASLFDGIEVIDPAFEPHAGREWTSNEEVAVDMEQRELAF
jgi:hypothetical protein